MAFSFGQKIRILTKLIFKERRVLSALLSQRVFGYLLDVGWFNSFNKKEPVDSKLNPIPWITYPALDFLVERLNKSLEILEFGSGNSTYFFAERAKQVTTIEHNIEWYNKLKENIPDNVTLLLVNSDNYFEPLSIINKKFDIVFIDGIQRVECCQLAMEYLKADGVIVVDDSEREEYQQGIETIIKSNFSRLDFWGISPGYLYKKNTTIFYNKYNCLNI